MHLQRVRIPNFRNLKDFEILFTEEADDPGVEGGRRIFNSYALIGANGTGKSNLIEAIIMIFRDLDLDQVASLDYEMDYSVLVIVLRLGRWSIDVHRLSSMENMHQPNG